MHSPTLFFDFRCRGETHGRVFISSWPGNQCFCLGQPDSRSAPVTCSSYYWTLFHWQSRKEERRGTLIAHLNGGCHIINAYRPALQAVTETPSHGSREKEGEWDINSCERRDGYQRPEIKWLALKEMGPEMSQPSERGVRCTCFASLVQTFAFWSALCLSLPLRLAVSQLSLVSTCSQRSIITIRVIVSHSSHASDTCL